MSYKFLKGQLSGSSAELFVTNISASDALQVGGDVQLGGDNVSITGSAVTFSVADLTATANLDIGAFDLRAATLTADGLTSGRVVFAGTNGVLSDDADMSFSSDTLTVTKLGAYEQAGSVDFSDEAMTNVNVDSGAIDGTIIGANSAAAGTFAALVGTTISGSSTADGLGTAGKLQVAGMASIDIDGTYISSGSITCTSISGTSISGSTTLEVGGHTYLGQNVFVTGSGHYLQASALHTTTIKDEENSNLAMTLTSDGGVIFEGPSVSGSVNEFSVGDNLYLRSMSASAPTSADLFLFVDDSSTDGVVNVRTRANLAADFAGTVTTTGLDSNASGELLIDIQGMTDLGEAIVDADLFIIDNGAGGTLRKFAASRLKTYITSGGGDSVTSTAYGDSDSTMAAGVNYPSAAITATRVLTLPGSPDAGALVHIKGDENLSDSVKLTVTRAGSQVIDDNLTTIDLESPNAAITLVYVTTDEWRII